MANTGKLIYKLQMALKQKNIFLTINTFQRYSNERDRYVKVYAINMNRRVILTTSSQIKIVRLLAELWEYVNDQSIENTTDLLKYYYKKQEEKYSEKDN